MKNTAVILVIISSLFFSCNNGNKNISDTDEIIIIEEICMEESGWQVFLEYEKAKDIEKVLSLGDTNSYINLIISYKIGNNYSTKTLYPYALSEYAFIMAREYGYKPAYYDLYSLLVGENYNDSTMIESFSLMAQAEIDLAIYYLQQAESVDYAQTTLEDIYRLGLETK